VASTLAGAGATVDFTGFSMPVTAAT